MGHWGVDIRDCDIALDYLENENYVRRLNKIKTGEQAEDELKRIESSNKNFNAVLVVADYLLEQNVEIPKDSKTVARALERAYEDAEEWGERVARREALDDFKERWQGRKAPKLETDE